MDNQAVRAINYACENKKVMWVHRNQEGCRLRMRELMRLAEECGDTTTKFSPNMNLVDTGSGGLIHLVSRDEQVLGREYHVVINGRLATDTMLSRVRL